MPVPTGASGQILFLMVTAGAWYLAGLLLAGISTSLPPLRRAIASAIPILLASLLAALLGEPSLAIAFIFGSSVAAVTLVLGIIAISQPREPKPAEHRAWAFLLPVAIITLLIGFKSHVGILQAGVLLIEGLLILALFDRPSETIAETSSAPPINASATVGRISPFRWAMAILFAIIGTIFAIQVARAMSIKLNGAGAGLVATLMLCPLLVLELIGYATKAAAEEKSEAAISSVVWLVVINLCIALPIASVAWAGRARVLTGLEPAALSTEANPSSTTTPTSQPTTAAITTSTSAPSSIPSSAPSTAPAEDPNRFISPLSMYLPFPMGAWRVDVVMLLAVSLLLLPASQGRWSLGKREGYSLLAAYLSYLAATAWMAR